jgi:hypothetical protein
LQGISIDVYPNPSAEKFTVAYHGLDQLPISYTVTNVLGQTVSVASGLTLNSSELSMFSIDCTAWENGVYYLIISSERNQKTIKLVVGDF